MASIIQRHLDEHEERLAMVEEICLDKHALIFDDERNETYPADDHDANRGAYVAVFHAWSKGMVPGTAEQVFDAIQSVLED